MPSTRAAPRRFISMRIESAVAADVEDAAAAQVLRQGMGEAPPLDRRIVAEEVLGCRLHAVEVDIVEPGPEGLGPRADLVPARHGGVLRHVRPRGPARG
jgi:hypothetical protein